MTTVLVVEDDPGIVQAVTDILEDEGYKVVTAMGRAALTEARVRHPDVVLLDIAMPEMDGIEVARHLRADPVTHDIPIILMSATHRLSARAAGVDVDLLLPKPFEVEELLASVGHLTA